MYTEANIAAQVSRLVVGEDAKTLKIVVVRDGRVAGLVAELLARSQGVPKKNITQLGYTASDQQNDMQLRNRNLIVIIPESIFRNRACTFYPPSGTTLVMLINGLVEPVTVISGECFEVPFEIFNKSDILDSQAGRIKRVYSFTSAAIPLDQATAEQIDLYAWKNLLQENSTFEQLLNQAKKENSLITKGIGIAESSNDVAQAFSAWLQSLGIETKFLGFLAEKQVFIYSGNAQNPQNGGSFKWSVSVYFDITHIILMKVARGN
ncbi:MAG: hypothetical protein HYZ49_08665 [Chloroflexi bacterium]|nr:hypothetical protein [Chloroflexota bacterium]